tara:strand:- start:124 stop:354 length:231 start_codon:yes stop_codon:yes gene_type:complete
MNNTELTLDQLSEVNGGFSFARYTLSMHQGAMNSLRRRGLSVGPIGRRGFDVGPITRKGIAIPSTYNLHSNAGNIG